MYNALSNTYILGFLETFPSFTFNIYRDVARIGSTLSALKLAHDNDFADELKIARGFDDLDDVYTILHDAVKEGNKLRAKLILRSNRVNVNHKTKKGRTPLFYAIFGMKTPDYEMMDFLEQEGK